MIRVVLLSLLAAGCAPAVATSTAAPAEGTSARQATAVAQEKKLCRPDTELGSIMPRRTCHTATEWAAIDAANAENAQRALDNRRPTGGPNTF